MRRRILATLAATVALLGIGFAAAPPAEAGPCTWWNLPYLCRR